MDVDRAVRHSTEMTTNLASDCTGEDVQRAGGVPRGQEKSSRQGDEQDSGYSAGENAVCACS